MIKILIPIAILSGAFATQAMFTINAKKETQVYKAKCDSIQYVADSLYRELLPTQIELARRDMAYEIFVKRNPEAASQYVDIISNETE